MKKDILLIRHSEQLKIEDTKKYDISSQINNEKVILSVKGERLAKEISELEEMKNVEMVWSSNYVRALATAKYIADKNHLHINVDNRLNERKLGDLDKLKELCENIQNNFTEEQFKDKDFKNLGGESYNEVSQRMRDCFNDISTKYKEKKIAIISHGVSIKFFLLNYCKLDENYNVIYNKKILNVESPSIFNLKVDDGKIYDINQIY